MRIRIEYLGRLLASKRATLATCKALAKQAHKAKDFRRWSGLMNKAKKVKRDLACLAYWLHTMLYAKGSTRVPVPQRGHSWTVADLMAITQLGNWLNQAD